MRLLLRRAAAAAPVAGDSGFVRGLGLFDSTMIVVGSMIGSGIFIVSADIARQTGSTGGLLIAWIDHRRSDGLPRRFPTANSPP